MQTSLKSFFWCFLTAKEYYKLQVMLLRHTLTGLMNYYFWNLWSTHLFAKVYCWIFPLAFLNQTFAFWISSCLGLNKKTRLHLSITCNPLYTLPYFNDTSYRYLLTNRFTFPYFQRFLEGNKTRTTDPSSIVGSSVWLFLPVFVSCPSTISWQNISQTDLNIWSFCSKSFSSTSNCSPVLILGCNTSLIVRSPVLLEKIGREFNRADIFTNNKSISKILLKGCIGCFLILLQELLSIVLTWWMWASTVPLRCWDSVGAR